MSRRLGSTDLPLMPPRPGRCLDSLWFGFAKDQVLEGAQATWQNVDEPSRLQPICRIAGVPQANGCVACPETPPAPAAPPFANIFL
jgi:hypothetical protein